MLKVICVLSILVLGCVHTPEEKSTPIHIGEDIELRLPATQLNLPVFTQHQLLIFEYQARRETIQAVLVSKVDSLQLVGLLPLGGEAFRVEYSHGNIEVKGVAAKMAPFDLKFALADIILVYAQRADLGRWLSKGAIIKEDPKSRQILGNGKPIVEINFKENNHLASEFIFKNKVRGYSLSVKPVVP